MLSKIGNARGSTKLKENRAQRLINSWATIKRAMERIVIADSGKTLPARCAYGVLLMMETGIRLGNTKSAEGFTTKPHPNVKDKPKFIRTFGLTTLERCHTDSDGKSISLSFIGKRGVPNKLRSTNNTLIKYYPVLAKRKAETFLDVDKYTLAAFVKEHIGECYSPKDLRTAMVNLRFIDNLKRASHRKDVKLLKRKGQVKKTILKVVEQTADQIGHTRGVCKAAYISKHLWEWYSAKLAAKCG